MQRQVTQGNWDVTKFLGVDENTKTFYYESAEESPIRRSIYKIDAKGVKTKLSTEEGMNKAVFSDNFRLFREYLFQCEYPGEDYGEWDEDQKGTTCSAR